MNTIDARFGRFFPTLRRDTAPAPIVFAGAAAGGIPLVPIDFSHDFALASALLVALVGIGALAVAIGVKFDQGDASAEPVVRARPDPPLREARRAARPAVAGTPLLAASDD